MFSHRRASSDAEMQNFRIGDVVTGVVQSVKVYGAFLDIGGAMGLLHISQITHERLTTVEQVLQVQPKPCTHHCQHMLVSVHACAWIYRQHWVSRHCIHKSIADLAI